MVPSEATLVRLIMLSGRVDRAAAVRGTYSNRGGRGQYMQGAAGR